MQLRNLYLHLLAVLVVFRERFQDLVVHVEVKVFVLRNLALQMVDVVKKELEGDELLKRYTLIASFRFLDCGDHLLNSSKILLNFAAVEANRKGLQESLNRDSPGLLVGLVCVELKVPKVLPEFRLQVHDVLELNRFFAFKKNLAERFIGLQEVFLAGLDRSRVYLYLVLLFPSRRALLSELTDCDRELFFRHLAVWVLLEAFAELGRRDLEEKHEEEELSEGNFSVAVDVNFL